MLIVSREADQKALVVKVDSLSGTVRDIDQQTRAHNLATLRLEKGEHPPCNPSTGKDGNLSSSCQTPLPINKTTDDRPPRYFKMEFPTYDGEVDPLSWLNRCDLFFNAQRTTKAEKVGIASFHLVGDAHCGMASTRMSTARRRGTGLLSWFTPNLVHLRAATP